MILLNLIKSKVILKMIVELILGLKIFIKSFSMLNKLKRRKMIIRIKKENSQT